MFKLLNITGGKGKYLPIAEAKVHQVDYLGWFLDSMCCDEVMKVWLPWGFPAFPHFIAARPSLSLKGSEN